MCDPFPMCGSLSGHNLQTFSGHVLLVVGKCGDGKTTLVNALRDPQVGTAGKTGKVARGVTKDLTLYSGKPVSGLQTVILDSPGVGDKDITPMQLVSLIEAAFMSQQVTANGGIDRVIVTTKITDGWMRLGAQVVKTLVDKGFIGGSEKWGNVILTGTHKDKAEDDDIACFLHGIDGAVPTVREFYVEAPGQQGCVVMVSKEDYSPLWEAIGRLPLQRKQKEGDAQHSRDLQQMRKEQKERDKQQQQQLQQIDADRQALEQQMRD